MSQYNPYQPPETDVPAIAPDAVHDPAAVPDHIVEQLRGTRPWVIFLAVLGFLGGGFMILAGLAMLVLSSTMKLPGWFGLIYLILSVVCVLPAVYMVLYVTSIGRLMRDPRMERLSAALSAQRIYWKAVGIMCVALMALYPILIGVLVVVGVKGLGK